MAASYESVRHDWRYEIDVRGVAEFGPHRVLRRFIPWDAVKRIDFVPAHGLRRAQWSVRASDGSRIKPKLEFTNSLECYNEAVRAWRTCARAPFARIVAESTDDSGEMLPGSTFCG